jgi:hypothetical protein
MRTVLSQQAAVGLSVDAPEKVCQKISNLMLKHENMVNNLQLVSRLSGKKNDQLDASNQLVVSSLQVAPRLPAAKQNSIARIFNIPNKN